MERNRNESIGPKYAIRLRDLRSWHVLSVTCFACRHQATLVPDHLRRRFGEQATVVTLEHRLRCKRCGNRHHNSWAVVRLPRD
ncbi:MAG: hypothetical protein ACFCVH_01545 [Alphaproteobacteria bacterium]